MGPQDLVSLGISAKQSEGFGSLLSHVFIKTCRLKLILNNADKYPFQRKAEKGNLLLALALGTKLAPVHILVWSVLLCRELS